MGYYIRVLATDATPIRLDDLLSSLPTTPAVDLTVVAGDRATWSELILRHSSGSEIAVIEKNDVVAGELGADEMAEFLDEIRHAKPLSAVLWLQQYFPRVKTIYAFQILKGANIDDGWTAVHALQKRISSKRGGILQADGEGFSNEDGDCVLWQFADQADGPWNMAVLNPSGHWVRFEMDLGDRKQRAHFLEGRVPDGIRTL